MPDSEMVDENDAARRQYGALESGDVGSGRTTRRTVAVVVIIGLSMLMCAKVATAHRGSGSISLLLQGNATSGAAAANATTVAGSDGDSGSAAADASAADGVAETSGWDKTEWSAGDWTIWIIMGPVATVVAVYTISSVFGVAWAAGLLVLLGTVDIFAFYYNL